MPFDWAPPDGHFHTQSNGEGGDGNLGFVVTNDGGVGFWNEFQARGDVPMLGYAAGATPRSANTVRSRTGN